LYKTGFVRPINELQATLKDDSANLKQTEKNEKTANASAKSKEVQPHPQTRHTVAPHLLLPNRTTTIINI
jgi:hypothetical protein